MWWRKQGLERCREGAHGRAELGPRHARYFTGVAGCTWHLGERPPALISVSPAD